MSTIPNTRIGGRPRDPTVQLSTRNDFDSPDVVGPGYIVIVFDSVSTDTGYPENPGSEDITRLYFFNDEQLEDFRLFLKQLKMGREQKPVVVYRVEKKATLRTTVDVVLE